MMSESNFDAAVSFAMFLSSVDDYPWRASVFLPAEGSWNLACECHIVRDQVTEYGPEPHPLEQSHGLRETLSVADFQSIAANAREQVGDPTVEQLLAAFTYYWKRGAFLDFGAHEDSA